MKKIIYPFIVVILIVITILNYKENFKEYAIFPGFKYNFVKGKVVEVLAENFRNEEGWQKAKILILEGEKKGELYDYTNGVWTRNRIRLVEGKEYIFRLNDSKLILEFEKISNKNMHILLIFIFVVLLVGRGKGLKAILALLFTGVMIIFLLVPLLLQGYNSIPLTIFICIWILLVTLPLIGGFNKKTLIAIIATNLGLILAGLFAYFSNKYLYLSGEYMQSGEILILAKGVYEGLDIKNMIFTATVIASLGAIMDTSISISSAMEEISNNAPEIPFAQLLKSGMKIGQDMIGTMINTLILAFVGSSLALIIGFFAYNIEIIHLVNSPQITMEFVKSLAGSIGIIITVPITAFVASFVYKKV